MTARRAGMAAAVLVAIALWSCSDLHIEPLPTIGSDEGDPVVATPSLAADIQPVFSARCAVVGCHITPTEANLGLVLTDPAKSHANLVGVPSVEFPGRVRVIAGDANGSYLVDKLESGLMPKQGPMLSPGTLQTIRNWIDQGALNN